jgi:NAD(P)H dehydrogenase (quinone)
MSCASCLRARAFYPQTAAIIDPHQGANATPFGTVRSAVLRVRQTQVAACGVGEGRAVMAKVLVLYYSSYGHIERMAFAEADGARGAGAEVDIKRVPELVPNKIALASHYKLDQIAPVANIDDLIIYDAIIFGTPTRFGNMAAQMKNFIDQAGRLWAKDKLVGKVGSVFTASATQHGGQEATILSFHIVLLHLGFIVVGLPYSFKGQLGIKDVHGATPYGATTIVGADGARMPSALEIEAAQYQGRHVAGIADGCHHVRRPAVWAASDAAAAE